MQTLSVQYSQLYITHEGKHSPGEPQEARNSPDEPQEARNRRGNRICKPFQSVVYSTRGIRICKPYQSISCIVHTRENTAQVSLRRLETFQISPRRQETEKGTAFANPFSPLYIPHEGFAFANPISSVVYSTRGIRTVSYTHLTLPTSNSV